MSALLDSLLTPQQRAQAAAVDAAMLAMANAQAAHPRLQAERAVLRTAAQAIDVATRPAFDRDYGSYTGSPADPRYVPDETVGDMLEAINCAEQALQMARDALEGIGCSVDTLTARSLFNEARDFLAVPQ